MRAVDTNVLVRLATRDDPSQVAAAEAAGCDRILLKPCMPDKLAEVAAELIQNAANRRTKS